MIAPNCGGRPTRGPREDELWQFTTLGETAGSAAFHALRCLLGLIRG